VGCTTLDTSTTGVSASTTSDHKTTVVGYLGGSQASAGKGSQGPNGRQKGIDEGMGELLILKNMGPHTPTQMHTHPYTQKHQEKMIRIHLSLGHETHSVQGTMMVRECNVLGNSCLGLQCNLTAHPATTNPSRDS